MTKKKILLLSDDLRMSSGVGTMSREFVMGTLFVKKQVLKMLT